MPTSPHEQFRYDEETRLALQRAFRDGWKILKEREPGHSWETHNDLKHDLSERLMGLADEGIRDLDGLLRQALDGLREPPAVRALKVSMARSKSFNTQTRRGNRMKAERPGERHLP